MLFTWFPVKSSTYLIISLLKFLESFKSCCSMIFKKIAVCNEILINLPCLLQNVLSCID